MGPLALDILRNEHRALSAMLVSMPALLRQARRAGQPPDFGLLRCMLFYVDEFPERLHHAKESALLFPLLRQRAPGLAPVLDRLDAEHAQGGRAVRDLAHALLAYEVMGESRRAAFEAALQAYVGFYLDHMGLEEREVLPVAARALGDEDWAVLDAAFGEHRDPLTGHEPAPDYRPLFGRILRDAPAPVGLGPAA